MCRFTGLQRYQTKSDESVLHDYVRRLRILFADSAHDEKLLSRQTAAIWRAAIHQRNV